MKDIVEELQEWASTFNNCSPSDTMRTTAYGLRVLVTAAEKIESLRAELAAALKVAKEDKP